MHCTRGAERHPGSTGPRSLQIRGKRRDHVPKRPGAAYKRRGGTCEGPSAVYATRRSAYKRLRASYKRRRGVYKRPRAVYPGPHSAYMRPHGTYAGASP